MMRPVAGNMHLPVRVGDGNNVTDGRITSLSSAYRHELWADVSAVRVVYANWYNDRGREAEPVNPIAVAAELRTESGAVAAVSFGGMRYRRVEPGCVAVSDPVAVRLRRGEAVVSRTLVSVGPGEVIPLGSQTDGAGGIEGVVCGGRAGVRDLPPSTSYGHGPWAILGESGAAGPVAVVVGDSNAAGFGDRRGSACHRGWVRRALDGRLPYLNLAISGATALGTSTAEDMRRRLRLAALVRPSFAISALGTNDLQGGGVGEAEMMTRLRAHWRALTGQGWRVIACTIPPLTTSTDGWASVRGQRVDAAHQVRARLNSWIRGCPEPLSGVVDIASAVGTEPGSGLWRPGHTCDGIHLSEDGHAAVARCVAALFGSPSNQDRKELR